MPILLTAAIRIVSFAVVVLFKLLVLLKRYLPFWGIPQGAHHHHEGCLALRLLSFHIFTSGIDSMGGGAGYNFKKTYPVIVMPAGDIIELPLPHPECLSATALLYNTGSLTTTHNQYQDTMERSTSSMLSREDIASHTLVWLKMPWEDSQEVSRFACRFGSSVGLRTVVLTVSHMDGTHSPTLARARLVSELSDIMTSTSAEGIILGGFEVAGALCLSIQSQLASKLVGTVVFDPCVGWSSYPGPQQQDEEEEDIRTRFLVQFAKDMDTAFEGAVLAWLPPSPSQPNTPHNGCARYGTSTPPVLLCVNSANVWMDCIQAFAKASVAVNTDMTVEIYKSVHTHEFMLEVEMWARSAVAVRGFQFQGSTSSTPLMSSYHKFRSLATLNDPASTTSRMKVCISGDTLCSWPSTPHKWSNASLDASITDDIYYYNSNNNSSLTAAASCPNRMSAYLPKPIMGTAQQLAPTTPPCARFTNAGKHPPPASLPPQGCTSLLHPSSTSTSSSPSPITD